MRRRADKWSSLAIAAWLLLTATGVAASSYADLDEKIVQAYNSDPKQTQDVYIYAMQIIERARLDHSRDSDSWKEKGEKLVTVSCFAQADKCLNDKNEREAYLWALRGITSGASRGDLGGVEMKQVYEYLKNVVDTLKSKLGNELPGYGQTKLEVLDWRRVRKSSEYRKDYRTDPAGRPEPKNQDYQVLSGPAADSSGLISIRVRLNFGSIIKVRFFPHKGWMVIDPPVMSGDYQQTWEECVEECIKINKLPGAPPPVRNKTAEKTIYYQPSRDTGSIPVGGDR